MTVDRAEQELPAAEVTYCKNHPERETLLRCNRCNEPICPECAVLTDVGYRCKECIRGLQDKYYNAEPKDNWIALTVAFVVTVIALPILGIILGAVLGFFFGSIIALVLGSAAGTSLAQLIRKAVGRRRGRRIGLFAIAGIILGILVVVVLTPFALFNIPTLIFGALAISTAYPFLR